ncbi:MAG: glycosyltransferase [Gemmatimonadales bacterium]|nr:glycosyltransferase [Gemmatimonadales bacterium]
MNSAHRRWVSGPAAIARERRLTVAAGVVAFGVAVPVVYDSFRIALRRLLAGEYLAALGDLCVVPLAGLLAYGCVVYLLARIGHLARLRAAAYAGAAGPLAGDEPDDDWSLVALVPSYREDPQVVLRTLLSAALQPHPRRSVVLLIDDPIHSGSASASLEETRALPDQVREMLRPMREHYELAVQRFDQRVQAGDLDLAAEARQVADLCLQAADWFEVQSDQDSQRDLASLFFADLTFRLPASKWRGEARRWAEPALGPGVPLSADHLRLAYQELLSVFRVQISSFERKRFANLSHAVNKAMNINAYLALLGGSYRLESGAAGLLLSRCPAADADLVVPDADFVLILDADTIISPDYTQTLIRRFRGAVGERLAVVQSPYSTFPGDRGVLQRVAGAQTDIQYLIHQGLTYYDATYWVGANALVRVAALRELAVREVERGFDIVKFLRDRTLIEDTESTIALVSKGWRLFNHPERLAFSMTPPDFGSLLVQRRRWATGGVQLVPNLLAYLRQRGRITRRLPEGFMRLHYLISLGPVSMALLVTLGASWDKELRTIGLLGVGLVYYAMYARDLHLVGYRGHDILRVIALNLVLIPVNIAGMLSSLWHGISGGKPRFRRTPKIDDRTRVPAGYLLAEFTLLALWSAQVVVSLARGDNMVGAFMLVHAVLIGYAISAFIGYRNSVVDIVAAARGDSGEDPPGERWMGRASTRQPPKS